MKLRQMISVVIVAVVVSFGFVGAWAGIDATSTKNPGVYLFESVNYRGRMLHLTTENGSVRPPFSVRSIQIKGPYSALVQQVDIFNRWDTYRASDPDVTAHGIMLVRAVSNAEENRPGVYLYERESYRGRYIYLPQSQPRLPPDWNDRASSARVVGGYRATLFGSANYKGTRTTIKGPDPEIGSPYGGCKWIWQHAAWGWEGTGPSCLPEFSSPEEIGDNQVSSVFISSLDTYSHSSRLVWPSGMWIWSVPFGAATAWKFNDNGTYTFASIATSGTKEIRGNYRLTQRSLNPFFLPYTVADFIETSNNKVYSNGKYTGNDRDSTYRYSYKDGGNTLAIISGSGSKTQTYKFRAQ